MLCKISTSEKQTCTSQNCRNWYEQRAVFQAKRPCPMVFCSQQWKGELPFFRTLVSTVQLFSESVKETRFKEFYYSWLWLLDIINKKSMEEQ